MDKQLTFGDVFPDPDGHYYESVPGNLPTHELYQRATAVLRVLVHPDHVLTEGECAKLRKVCLDYAAEGVATANQLGESPVLLLDSGVSLADLRHLRFEMNRGPQLFSRRSQLMESALDQLMASIWKAVPR